MPDKMPVYGLQPKPSSGGLIPCQVDVSEFELSGPLEHLEPIRGDGERYGYLAMYDHEIDRLRAYRGPQGELIYMRYRQLYYRPPYSTEPQHPFEHPGYVGLLYRYIDPPDDQPKPLKNWRWDVTEKIDSTRCYSCHYAGDGIGYFFGGYDPNLKVFRSDEWGNYAYLWWQKRSESESVSCFWNAPGNHGLNFGTESGAGPELYWAPSFDGNRVTRSAHYGGGTMYALGREGCKKSGNLVCISSNRDVGGRLALYVDGFWPTFTQQCRDADGHPLIIWDALWLPGGTYVAGCSRGLREYSTNPYHSGRLAFYRDGKWEVRELQPGGTGGITSFVELADHVYMTTTYGEVWKTRDFNSFELDFTVGPDVVGKDVHLFEVEGRLVAVSAWGRVYEKLGDSWTEALDFQGAFWAGRRFCSVQPGPRGLIAGPVTSERDNGFKILRLRYDK